jgi:hypothetical protein
VAVRLARLLSVLCSYTVVVLRVYAGLHRHLSMRFTIKNGVALAALHEVQALLSLRVPLIWY